MESIAQSDLVVNGSDVRDRQEAALISANRQLDELRHAYQAARQTNVAPVIVPTLRVAAPPAHLGWGSAALTKTLCKARVDDVKQGIDVRRRAATVVHPKAGEDPQPPTVKLYPSIGLGMLEHGQAAAGRIWLLLRHLDAGGRGWVNVEEARSQLTASRSKMRVCGQRRLRALFRQGEGIFWTRDDRGRLWLHSAEKVAQALKVERLSGRPIELPIASLLGGVRIVRANLYACFHSGRKKNNPISRATIKQITHVPERTQRVYDSVAGVERRSCIAVGERHTPENLQNRAWRHGNAVFAFVDHEGRQGGAGERYVAWRLPNQYRGCHRQAPKGRQKKINRWLNDQHTDLVDIRARGNGVSDSAEIDPLFHPDGCAAATTHAHHSHNDAYWHSGQPQTTMLWHVIPAQEDK